MDEAATVLPELSDEDELVLDSVDVDPGCDDGLAGETADDFESVR